MSQATLPASAMILVYFGAAMKPFLASSKSRLSSKGSDFLKPFCNSMVNFEGILPFESKCLPSLAPGSDTAAPPPAAKACDEKPITPMRATAASALRGVPVFIRVVLFI